jgi:hypothetical protein
MDPGSVLFYRADGVLLVAPAVGKLHIATEAERADANATLFPVCTPPCETR